MLPVITPPPKYGVFKIAKFGVSPPNLYSGKSEMWVSLNGHCPGTSAPSRSEPEEKWQELCRASAIWASSLTLASIGSYFRGLTFPPRRQRCSQCLCVSRPHRVLCSCTNQTCCWYTHHPSAGQPAAVGQRDCSASHTYCLRTQVILLSDARGNSLPPFKVFRVLLFVCFPFIDCF